MIHPVEIKTNISEPHGYIVKSGSSDFEKISTFNQDKLIKSNGLICGMDHDSRGVTAFYPIVNDINPNLLNSIRLN